ncbi:MAG: hypothetical protein ACRDXC_13370, partial [Acidimicrobiales bacterium]
MGHKYGHATLACALAGCEAPVVQRPGGGRPRLYCSDAHRAEARRRRLGGEAATTGEPPSAATGTDLDGVRRLLFEAVSALERFGSTHPRDDVLVSGIRAEATAQILRAQQDAADAARQAAAVEGLLAGERAKWGSAFEELDRERAQQREALEELSGALGGARSELEEEILRHHDDAATAESSLRAARAAHGAAMEQANAQLDELRHRLAGAQGAAEQGDQRAARAEQALSARSAAVVELEVRTARAEEQSLQAASRLEEVRSELALLRKELVGERRHHRTVEADLRRQRTPLPAARPARAR